MNDAVSSYITTVAEKAGVETDIISTILAFLMSFLSGCLPTPTPATLQAGGGLWGETLLKASIIRAGIRPRDPRFPAILAAMKGVATQATPEEVSAFLTMVGPAN